MSLFLHRAGMFAGYPGYLLNQYPGAAAAYSLRVLSSAFASSAVVRVRRSSDNAEADFTAAEITDGTLTTWTGANDGYVVTWYDQSCNARNATQATAGNQPQIVAGGELVTGGINVASGNYLITSSAFSQSGFTFLVGSITGTGPFKGLTGTNAVGSGGLVITGLDAASPKWSLRRTADATVAIDSSVNAASDALVAFKTLQNNMELFVSGVSRGVDISTNTFGNVNYIFTAPVTPFIGTVKELIFYPTDESTNRTAIESNINAHYGIY